MPYSSDWQLKVRMGLDLRSEVQALARRRRQSINRLVASLLERELGEADSSGSPFPSENVIREMAILIAVEQILKLQEASMPGGTTLSRRLLADAAKAAIARMETITAFLRERETE